jgi:uncharacterized membrane protein YcaP (DUF421 family)
VPQARRGSNRVPAWTLAGMDPFETPLWEIVVRGTAIYAGIAVLFRLLPKRHTADIAPNDMITMVVVGSLAADAIAGAAKAPLDLAAMAVVVILWDYLGNLAEYHFPRFRRVAQDTPTLLVRDGRMLEANMRREKLTQEELLAALRRQGILDIAQVSQAVQEVDGRISVIPRKAPGG